MERWNSCGRWGTASGLGFIARAKVQIRNLFYDANVLRLDLDDA